VPISIVYSPRPARVVETEADPAPVLESRSLVGKAVGIVDNGKLLELGILVEEELLRLGAGSVLRFQAPRYTDLATAEFLDDIASKVTGAVTGLGNCGSCTVWSCHASVELARRGIRTPILVTEPLRGLAEAATEKYGGDPKLVFGMHEDVDFLTGDSLREEAVRVAGETLGLPSALTAEEALEAAAQ
jgi:hypothetical protein